MVSPRPPRAEVDPADLFGKRQLAPSGAAEAAAVAAVMSAVVSAVVSAVMPGSAAPASRVRMAALVPVVRRR